MGETATGGAGAAGGAGATTDPPAIGAQAATAPRPHLLRRGLRLEYLTVAWNVVEGVVAVAAAIAAGSVALLGFGVDSFVESASGCVLVWRLFAEQRGGDDDVVERVERRAQRLVGASLFALAAYVLIDAVHSLVTRDRPAASPVGLALTTLSLPVMWWLARAKLRVARALGSRALETDAFQTTACYWLSLATLAGVGLNAAFSWWWADPASAIVVAGLVAREGWEAWSGEEG